MQWGKEVNTKGEGGRRINNIKEVRKAIRNHITTNLT